MSPHNMAEQAVEGAVGAVVAAVTLVGEEAAVREEAAVVTPAAGEAAAPVVAGVAAALEVQEAQVDGVEAEASHRPIPE